MLAKHNAVNRFRASIACISRPTSISPLWPKCFGLTITTQLNRWASSSSKRWQNRQSRDKFAKEARVLGFKSRAAYKLLEINETYRLFKPGQTVVDLGYAPGSWSQVAIDRTQPNGRVVGVDIIPAQPPKGVSTIQGNFLSPEVQADVQTFLQDPNRGRPRRQRLLTEGEGTAEETSDADETEKGYIDRERAATLSANDTSAPDDLQDEHGKVLDGGRVVDVVLSDMCAPWDQTSGFWKRSLSDPYRMMNTSGMNFRDHAGSMDLCRAALRFCFNTLHTGGHFVCKFYQGAEEKALEMQLKKLFQKVHREKPDSSRSDSKEAYFVALRRKSNTEETELFPPT